MVHANDQLTKAEMPDYPEKAERWFRSKWWSVPLLLGANVATGVVGFIWGASDLWKEFWLESPDKPSAVAPVASDGDTSPDVLSPLPNGNGS